MAIDKYEWGEDEDLDLLRTDVNLSKILKKKCKGNLKLNSNEFNMEDIKKW
jgi:hypothetical protein